MVEMPQIIDQLLEVNRPKILLNPIGIVIHSTDDPGATALNIRNYFNSHPELEVSAHLAVDWMNIICMIPYELGSAEVAWHAGHMANSKFFGIELCEINDPGSFIDSYQKLIALVRYICWIYNWPLDDNHIFSHAQISEKWHETDHTDPLPYFAKHNKTWNDFMNDLKIEIIS